jgi:hypothetical protein
MYYVNEEGKLIKQLGGYRVVVTGVVDGTHGLLLTKIVTFPRNRNRNK